MLSNLLALGSAIGGGAIDKALGGGNSAAPAAPISNTASFGPIDFGSNYYGSDAVAAAPSIADAKSGSASRWIPWIVGGVVALALAALVLFGRRRKN